MNCKYLFIPNVCTNTFSETKNEYRCVLQYLVVAHIVENQPEIKVVEPKLGYTRTWSLYPIVVSYHWVPVWMFPLWMCS